MKNGGMISKSGNLLIATAAKAYSVPIIILGSAIKLTPHFPFD
jgi:translation initiation factor 2B subunit (eIF-2B alpha/beta/delta family)